MSGSQGAEPLAGLEALTRANGRIAPVCLDEEPGGTRLSRVRPPGVDPHLDARSRKDRMKVALVAGVHPVADDRRWAVVARSGSPTVMLREARLFPFTKAGKETGFEAAWLLRARQRRAPDWTAFVARVLVEGSWNRPRAVTPAWVIEGLERPVDVEYYFD